MHALRPRASAALLVAVLALAVFTAPAAARPRGPDVGPSDGKDIRRTEIAPGIWQFTTWRDAYVRELNTVVIVNDADVLVFDTQTRPSCARAIIAQIKQLTPKPVRYVVNSHWHPDHWSGNEAFREAWPGLDIIATRKADEVMHAVAPAWPNQFPAQLEAAQDGLAKEIAAGKQDDGTPLTPALRAEDEDDVRNLETFTHEMLTLHRVFPTVTYAGTMTLEHGGRTFRFLDVMGDAEGTTVLWLPKDKVLVTGDAVSYPIPYSSRFTSRHLATLRELAQLDPAVIVPGHGPAFRDHGYLELEADLLQAIVDGVHAELAKGVLALADVQAVVTAETLRESFTHGDPDLDQRFHDRVKAFVKFAVAEARDGVELPQ